MPRRGENIYKRKDGRWEGRFIQGRTSSGKAIYCYLYASSYKEIKQKMEQAKSNDKESLQTMTVTRDISDITFQDAALGWVNSIIPQVKESTYAKYENLLKCYILPALGEKAVPDISHETVEALCNNLLIYGGKKGQGLSPKTVSDSLTIIRSILQYSVKKGIVSCCSAQSVIIKQQSKKMQVLSRREQEKLCSFLFSNLDERNLGILVCLFTGLRIGEICALKWGDISLSEQVINVRFTIQRIQDFNSVGKKTKIIITSPKSPCSCRTIPLPPELANLLRKYKSSDNAYVLTGMNNTFIEPRTMQNHFRRVLLACGLNQVNFHTLRHTFATRCVEVGFDIKSLSEILGHANVNITMNRYVHPSIDLKRENMLRLANLIAVK